MGKFFAFYIPALGVLGGILAWAYQTGSARLGVVDLFACEISTLCRVITVVGTAHRYVAQYNEGASTAPAGAEGQHVPANQFASQEGYFPVFESNTRDLQKLEARVVIHITEFYTYMKAFRDYLRKLAAISPRAEVGPPSENKPTPDSLPEAITNVVYMLFLSLESARLAIWDLVEFEPEKAERTIVILISELEAFGFLCRRFTEESNMRYQRLRLREADYKYVVPRLVSCVQDHRAIEKKQPISKLETVWYKPPKDSEWEPAVRLLLQLEAQFHNCPFAKSANQERSDANLAGHAASAA
jgi:hypothetical protein